MGEIIFSQLGSLRISEYRKGSLYSVERELARPKVKLKSGYF